MVTLFIIATRNGPIKMYNRGRDPLVKTALQSDLIRIIIGLARDNGTVTRYCVSSQAYNYDCVEMLMVYCFGQRKQRVTLLFQPCLVKLSYVNPMKSCLGTISIQELCLSTIFRRGWGKISFLPIVWYGISTVNCVVSDPVDSKLSAYWMEKWRRIAGVERNV